MALTLGTNCGFVATAPTADPGEGVFTIDDVVGVTRHTSPANAGKIVEVGWWCDNATEEANFEMGLYAADGAVVPGEAGTLLQVSRTNAKGTTSGWKKITVNWNISPNTTYWIGLQVDNTPTTTSSNWVNMGGAGIDNLGAGKTTLPDPAGGGALIDSDAMDAFYAVYKNTYTLNAGTGSVTLTGQDILLATTRLLNTAVGAFNLTGIDTLFAKGYNMAVSVGEFMLTGINVILRSGISIFVNKTKNSTTFTNKTKNTATFANIGVHSTTLTNKTKNTPTFTNKTKNTPTFTNKEKS